MTDQLLSTPDEIARGKTNMLLGVEAGNVFVRFPQPMQVVVMEPQNAFEIAEALARAAHAARFGENVPNDQSYLAEQVRLRVTEEMRDRKVARVAILLQNMRENPKTPGYWAMTIVDTLLSDIA